MPDVPVFSDNDPVIPVQVDDFGDPVDAAPPVTVSGNAALSGSEAKELTDEITAYMRRASEKIHELVARAHAGKAHLALGYATWGEYVTGELDMSVSRSYQLINLNRVISAFDEALPDGASVELTEAVARDVHRDLDAIAGRIREETAGLEAGDAAARAGEIVEEERSRIRDSRATAKKAEADYPTPVVPADDVVGDDGGCVGASGTAPAEVGSEDDWENVSMLDDAADKLLERAGVDPETGEYKNGRTPASDGGTPASDGGRPPVSETVVQGDPRVEILSRFLAAADIVEDLPEPDVFAAAADFLGEGELRELRGRVLECASWMNRAADALSD